MSSAAFAPTAKARTALSTEVVAGTACQPLKYPLRRGGLFTLSEPMRRRANPDDDPLDRGAMCGKLLRTVRRKGRAAWPFPAPIGAGYPGH